MSKGKAGTVRRDARHGEGYGFGRRYFFMAASTARRRGFQLLQANNMSVGLLASPRRMQSQGQRWRLSCFSTASFCLGVRPLRSITRQFGIRTARSSDLPCFQTVDCSRQLLEFTASENIRPAHRGSRWG